jgi:hypothetical protein
MKWSWILSKAFFASTEMTKCFLSLLQLMCSITLVNLPILKHHCIPGMKLTWSCWMMFLIRC